MSHSRLVVHYHLALAACVVGFVVSTMAFAQDAKPQVTAETKALLTEAYGLSRLEKPTLETFEKMITLCEQAEATALSPELLTYSKRLKAWALNKRGEAYSQQAADAATANDADAAAAMDAKSFADFDASIKNDPRGWKAHHNRGVCHALAGRVTEGIADFTKTIELKKEYVNAWYNRAELQLDTAKYDAAIADYTMVLSLKPTDVDALIARGDAHRLAGKSGAAVQDYGKALEVDPTRVKPMVLRAIVYANQGKWELAAVDFRAALEKNVEDVETNVHAAWLMSTCPEKFFRNSEQAIECAERARKFSTAPDWLLLDTLAAAYANAGRYDDAIAALEPGIPTAPAGEQDGLKERLALYKAGKPYRQPAAVAPASTQ